MKTKTKMKPFKPASIIALSFVSIIVVGTLLFTLPCMTRDHEGLDLLTALFTTTSSVCVTGLTLIDPAVALTRYGQILLMLLIEAGSISIVTFATFFIFAFKKRYGLRSVRLAQEYTNLDSLSQVRPLVKMIILATIVCQLIGSVFLCFRFVPKYHLKGIWISVFTAVSAYCNAGFDLFGFEKEFGSLTEYSNDYYVMFVIMALVVIGSIGFFVLYDIIRFRKTKHLSLHTKVALLFTAIMICVGTVGVFVFESENSETIGNMPFFQKLFVSLFESVSARSAGFSVIEAADMNDITKIIMLFLMFVGAVSGSMGGGIKITTFAVLVMTVISVVNNKSDTVVLGKRVDKRVVSKSLAITFLSLAFIFFAFCVLLINNPQENSINVFFEAVAAFSTAGISTGITMDSNVVTLLTLIVTMFVGKLGPICFIVALNIKDSDENCEVLPEGRIMVG